MFNLSDDNMSQDEGTLPASTDSGNQVAGEVGGGHEGEGGGEVEKRCDRQYMVIDPMKVLKKAPSSPVWKLFNFRQYDNKKIDQTKVYCKVCEAAAAF